MVEYMQYTTLGNSELNVSRICMGCMGFGDAGNGQHSWTLDEEHSREIIKRGLALGINFFDTAIGYQGGTSEQYLGERCGTMPNVMRQSWQRSFCRGQRRISKKESRDSSISRG